MKRSRTARLAIAAIALGALGFVVAGAPASAESGCSGYPLYSALGSASGVRTVQHAPGITVVTDADGGLPAAQAQFDSVSGSIGWAGAPYSATVADNVGQAQQQPNDVSVFAFSSYPTTPEGSKETPVGTLQAKSDADGSTADYDGGGPSSDQSSTAHVHLSVAASCAVDGTVVAVADNAAEGINIGGVLRIASMSSHAKVVVDPDGQRHVEGTMIVDGATVLGQPVSITDQGVVVGSPVLPTPANPLSDALKNGGISVHYIAAVEDAEGGEVFAPGLEIEVAQDVPGSGPKATTYTFGRAYARGVATLGDVVPDVVTGPKPTPPTAAPVVSTAPAIAPTPTGQVAAPAAAPSERISLGASRIANWSIAPAYFALAAGVLLLLAVRFVFERVAVRFRWT